MQQTDKSATVSQIHSFQIMASKWVYSKMNKDLCDKILFHTVFLLLSVILVVNAGAVDRQVRVGVYENKPLVFKDVDGAFQGITIDILNEVAKRKQWQLDYIPGTWAENLERLDRDLIDLLVAIAWSPARAEKYQFTDKTIVSNWAHLYSSPDKKFASLLSLEGKTVALVEKDIYAIAFVDLVKRFQMQVILRFVHCYKGAMQAVVAGSADVALVSRLFGLQMAKEYKLVKTPIVFSPIEIRYAAPLGNTELPQVIDVVISELEQDKNSVYYQSIDRWISGKTHIFSSLWIGRILQGAFFCLFLALCGVFYSRRQIRFKTRELHDLLVRERGLRRALGNSEEKYRLSFKISPDSMLLTKADGTCVEVNQNFCKSLGYTTGEVIGQTTVDLGIWKDLGEREKIVAALEMTGSVANFEAEFVRKDGVVLSALVSASLVEINKEPYVLSIVRDIGVFKKQQQRLQQAGELWQRTFDAITDIITVQDTDMRILKGNKAAREFYAQDDIVGKTCFNLLHGQSLPCKDCSIKKSFIDRTSYSGFVYDEKRKKTFAVTTHLVLSEEKAITQIVRVAKDVTEKIAANQERSLLSRAIDQSTDAIIITDDVGLILYVNPAFEHHSGYSRTEVLGQNPRFLQSGQHNKAFYEELWHTILSGNTWQGKFINQTKGGELYHEKSTISPVKDSEGKLINFIAVNQNVTHERELEQQLQQAQKLESIGTLAGGIAHDFNNILGVILGFAQMAAKQLPDSTAAREDIDEIIVAGQRAVDLVKQILAFSRQENEEFKPIKIQTVVKETLKLLKASLPSTIRLEQMIDADCKPIHGDPTQLHQVLLNLCTNAKHALYESKGTISVFLRQRDNGSSSLNQKFSYLPGAGYLELEVIDDGCGMDRRTIERIFDPFFTTKAKGQGTGLGLAVSYGIVKQHGGQITVDSVVGEGTTFHIFLPTIDSEVEKISGMTAEPIPTGNERVVLVDDERHLVDIMERTLSGLGYTVTSFTESRKALIWMQNHIDSFDLLLTDMTMPDVTGADLTEKLLALRPDLPIVLCTGYSEILGEEQAKNLGIREYILKPVTKQQLARKLYKVLHP